MFSNFFPVHGQQQEPVILNRLQAQLYALATDPDTFLTEPHPDDAEEFTAWKPELDKRQGEISELMVSNANIRKNYSTLVPEKVIKVLSFSLLSTYLSNFLYKITIFRQKTNTVWSMCRLN